MAVEEAQVVEQPAVATSTEPAPASSEPKKGNGCWKWGCGCLIALVVLAVAAFFGLIIIGRSVMNTPEFKQAMEEAKQQQMQEQQYPEYNGEEVSEGDLYDMSGGTYPEGQVPTGTTNEELIVE